MMSNNQPNTSYGPFFTPLKNTLIRLVAVVLMITGIAGTAVSQRMPEVSPWDIIEYKSSFSLSGVTTSVPNQLPLIDGNSSVYNYNLVPEPIVQTSRTIKNIITLSIMEETPIFLPQDFTATVEVKIDYGHTATTTSSLTKVFTVDYKVGAGQKYNARQYFHFDGAEYVKITAVHVNAPTINGVDTRSVLKLENEVKITRFFELPAVIPNPTFPNPATTPLPLGSLIPDRLKIEWFWPLNTGNNATQVEWSWIDDDMEDNYKTNNVLDDDLIFANCTRIDLGHAVKTYDIPLLYNGTGTLYYRIRASNIKENGGRSDGPWTKGDPFSFSGHNKDLNWQATTTFAEEGKRKSVIGYFDGSLRQRQTVTKDNASNTVIAAETFYDAQGRPAIQILPTPILNSAGADEVIKYRDNLNKFNSQAAGTDPADMFDFDLPTLSGSETPGMATSTGSSQYYSPANPGINDGPNKYIPNAEEFPYSVTRYTPDATGRIMKQSGVGAEHQMGGPAHTGDGHETKYYYGVPAQEELDGLFGTEAGYFSHYSKNMVQDANGQVSVSYVDMFNRTIATALAGTPPPGMQAINIPSQYPGQAGTYITRNLLDVATNTVKDNQYIESINTILVPTPTAYQFEYTVTPQALQMATCSTATQYCYDCVYDLEISIADESGEQAPVLYTFSNIPTAYDENCTVPTVMLSYSGTSPMPPEISIVGNKITINKTLNIGSYAVRKTLKIREASLQLYKELYTPHALCQTEQELITEIKNTLISVSGCGNSQPLTCQTCQTELGTEPQFTQRILVAMNLTTTTATQSVLDDIHSSYVAALNNCKKLCADVSQNLPTIRQMMLADMVPFSGQYARENATKNTSTAGVHTMFEKYNIFSTGSGPLQPFFKNPRYTPLNPIVDNFYHLSSGEVDQSIHPLQDNPLSGMSPAAFNQVFATSWTSSLIYYHPEYQRLLYAETLQPLYNWFASFMNSSSFVNAYNFGYLNPQVSDPILTHTDFANGAEADYHTQLLAAFSNYRNTGYTIWQLAYGNLRCTNSGTGLQACYAAAPATAPDINCYGFTTEEKNQFWSIFKGLYGAERERIMSLKIATHVPLSATDEADLFAQNYRLWFPKEQQQASNQGGFDWWPTNVPPGSSNNPPNGIPGGISANPGQSYGSNCESYIQRWKAQLMQCQALAALSDRDVILNEITSRMKEVCIKGSDPANAFGSSTASPALGCTTDCSFEQVIRSVFLQHSLLNGDGTYLNEFCNPFVIDWPKPYGKGPKLFAGELTGTLEKCNCDAWSRVRADAVAHGVVITNLAALNVYLQTEYGEQITQAMFDVLEQRCAQISEPVCHTEVYEISYRCDEPIPDCPDGGELRVAARQANTTLADPITCPQFEALITEFYFVNGYNYGPDCEEKFENFFNIKYGTEYSFAEVASLYQGICNKKLDVCNQFGCASLNHLVDLFVLQFGFPESDCDHEFVSFFNQQMGTSYSWEEIVALYQQSCNDKLDICSLTICEKLDYIIVLFHQKYGYPTKDCELLFTNFFNKLMHTTLKWEEIVDYYLQKCNIKLDVCSDPYSCPKLNNILSLFHQKYGYPSENCIDLFVAFFNDYFHTSYSWTEIKDLYKKACNQDLMVCDPYACVNLQQIVWDFHVQHGYPAGEDCENQFTVFFNQQMGTNYTFNEIQQLLNDKCPAIKLCQDKFSCYTLGVVVQQFHQQFGYPEGENCQTLFVQFFNNHYGTELDWNGIAELFTANCGEMPDICNPKMCVKHCSRRVCTDPAPYVLPVPLPFPSFLRCGAGGNSQRCINCAQLSQYTSEYKNLFQSDVDLAPFFTNSELTPEQVRYNSNFARFLNFRTGFQYDWIAYVKAAKNATCDLANYANNGAATQSVICRNTTALNVYVPPVVEPCQAAIDMATNTGQNLYVIRKETALGEFEKAYRAKCLDVTETFAVKYTTSEYHYTLYYYDQAGNLVKTVPPKGVHPEFGNAGFMSLVQTRRGNDSYLTLPVSPGHTFATHYRYNSLNQVVEQFTPDGNKSKFWYDALGRLVVSQNAKQILNNRYSYTIYDKLGRITEVGQKPQAPNSMTQAKSQVDYDLQVWLAGGGANEEVTYTVYDQPYPPVNAQQVQMPTPLLIDQQNLRNRVAFTFTKNLATDPYQSAATFYTYDLHGNVNRLLQDYREATLNIPAGTRYKVMDYRYDLVSGKVNQVAYQNGFSDAFYHRYGYDAENRITEAYTSRDAVYWERDAAYTYYKHGPLARTELGKLRVQGVDYAYTLQGWIKGINQSSLDPSKDIAQDGYNGSVVARDELSFSLHYYEGATSSDYKPIGTNNPFAKSGGGLANLYNGNIAAMSVNIAGLRLGANAAAGQPLLYRYGYDQLNRLVSMQAYNNLNTATNQWAAGAAINDYMESVSYDPNGNILTYKRNGDAARSLSNGGGMDDMTYAYGPNNNQLDRVIDAATDASTTDYPNYNDLKRMQPGNVAGQQAGNYQYDAIGNLVYDRSEGINNIAWNLYGKIASIQKATGTISYKYDASGNRISKTVSATGKTTIYVRDASGNVMSVYESIANAAATQEEVHLSGSSRLGMVNKRAVEPLSQTLNGGFASGIFSTFTRGEKAFELNNHLANVLATISDRKVQRNGGNGLFEYYGADVVTATDYYPGGMTMPERKFQTGVSSYRYSINGQEKETELNENITNAEYWEYDGRIGRRWNNDPKQKPYESPYLCFSGNPILNIDPLGDSTVPIPNGGTMDLPNNAKILEIFEGSTSDLELVTKLVNVKAGSVSKFELNGDTYEAMFSSEDGNFVGYGKNRSLVPAITLENSMVSETHTELTKPSTKEASSVFVFGMRSSAAAAEVPPAAAAGAVTTATLTVLAYGASAIIIVTKCTDLKLTFPAASIGGWFVYSKSGPTKPLDNLPQTLAGLEALRGQIKQRQTANNGKLTAEDKTLLGNIVTQEKYLGERNKAKDTRKKK